MEEESPALKEELHTLTRGLGSNGSRMLTIQDLPVEILLDIFQNLAARCERRSPRKEWMDILLVCSDWYRVACGAPELWRVIHVNSNPDWLRLCLTRSARALVDLHFSKKLPPAAIEDAIPLIIPHAQRIRAIHIIGHGQLSQETYLFFFSHPLPALEELSVLPAQWQSMLQAGLILQWTQRRELRSLALGSGMGIPRDPTIFRNMRTLELHEGCCTAGKFTIVDLVLALEAAASTLEVLTLSRAEPVTLENAQDLPRQLPNVHLKRLRRLHMNEQFNVVSPLNKHLTLPRDAFLNLSVYVDSLLYANGAAVLADIVPPGVRRVLDSTTEMDAVFGFETFFVRARNTSSKGVSSTFSSHDATADRVSVNTVGWRRYRHPGLGGITALHGSGLLTSLSITPVTLSHTVEEWTTLFDALRMLEKLAIVHHGAYVTTINAFIALSASTDRGSAHADHAPRSDTMLCPSLRSLRLAGIVHGFLVEEFSCALGRALRSRAAFEHRLEELVVERLIPSNVTRAELEGRMDAFTPSVGTVIIRW